MSQDELYQWTAQIKAVFRDLGVVARSKNSNSIALTYTFQTPDGGWLKRQEKTARNDLRIGLLPGASTPVNVLYADDRTYRVM